MGHMVFVKTEESYVKLGQHQLEFVLGDRRQECHVAQVLLFYRCTDEFDFIALADQYKVCRFLIQQVLCQPDDVHHVLCMADVSTIEKDHFLFKTKLMAIIVVFRLYRFIGSPVIQQVKRFTTLHCFFKPLQVFR